VIEQRRLAEDAGDDGLLVLDGRRPGGREDVAPRAVEQAAADGRARDAGGPGDAFDVDRCRRESGGRRVAGEFVAGRRQVGVPAHHQVARVVGEVDRRPGDRHDAQAQDAVAVISNDGFHGAESPERIGMDQLAMFGAAGGAGERDLVLVAVG
jgi:hypothetical protein